MTSRNYDKILRVANAANFKATSMVIGNTTSTVGYLASVDVANNILKVKISNSQQEFSSSEGIHSNIITVSGTANGSLSTTSLPFQANVMSGNITTAYTTIQSISPSTFIAEKNAFTQNPIVRLYSIYYPGEWYPPNPAGNPTGQGEGYAWPNDFPIRIAEIIGDIAEDINYNVSYAGTSYVPFPLNISGLEQASDGKINELTLSIFNVDNIISYLVENPYLAGINTSNSVLATVNGELVRGIDPRTVSASLFSNTEAQVAITKARSQGLAYDPAIVSYYGRSNATFDKSMTESVKGTWQQQKMDTRDMLGGIVEIKTTFANFLDYWPEYSLVTSSTSNTITVKNAIVYRVGDTVKHPITSNTSTIVNILDNEVLVLSNTLGTTSIGSPIYIVNTQADSESYLEDRYKINQLQGLSEQVATFGLVSWLQYFKIVTPKRKYYKNTCQWLYKGPECQYPGPGGLAIPGTNPVLYSNTSPIAANNAVASSAVGDICAKSLAACTLRNNALHFGGFPGVGRTVPQM